MIKYYPNDEDWPDAKQQGWNGPGWYFWDETQAHCHGPYETEEITNEKLKAYAKWLNGEEV